MNGTLNVFLIYTKEDSTALLQLLRHLDPVKNDSKIHFWYDDPVFPDKEWSPQIISRFEEADVYLLLVSNALMYSKFIEQVEFKMVIDRYKVAKSKVIPIILENCPWDVDFEADQYTFNLNELFVLPEKGKPVKKWDSADKAFQKSTDYIKKVLITLRRGDIQKPLVMKWEEGVSPANEKALEEKRVFAQQRSIEEAKAKQRAVEEQRLQEEIATKKWEEEEIRLRAVAEAKQKAKQEAWLREKVEEKSLGETTEARSRLPNQEKNTRKRILMGFSAAALVALLIAFFFRKDNSVSEELPTHTQQEIVVTKDADKVRTSTDTKKSQTPTLGAGASMSKLSVGQRYQKGIVFAVEDSGKKGIVAYTEDFGPMPWKEAMAIHKKLGEGWRLPTIKELKTLYKTIGPGADNQGELTNELYWSATPYDASQARLIRFTDGNDSFHYNSKGDFRKFLFRPVRDVKL